MIHPQGRENPNPSIEQDVHFLREVICELTALQQNDDLLERHQSFVHLVKQTLERVLGPCSVSLWCQDDNAAHLVECMILFNPANTAVPPVHEPCRLPLDNPAHRLMLETGKPYLAFGPQAGADSMINPLEGSLPCLAGLILERPYGRPVLINVDRLHDAERPINPRAFHLAVDLIRLIWSQLQAANQRQWARDHDPVSRALWDDVFVERAEQWACRAKQNDELFALAILALHGFRGMFAGQAHQWRQLSGAVSRILDQTLKQHGRAFILGRMADDVFALYLPHADNFITGTVTGRLSQALTADMPVEAHRQRWNMPGLELRWGYADSRDFHGSIMDMLNRQYRRMFTRSVNKQENVIHIDFQNDPQEAAHAGTNQS